MTRRAAPPVAAMINARRRTLRRFGCIAPSASLLRAGRAAGVHQTGFANPLFPEARALHIRETGETAPKYWRRRRQAPVGDPDPGRPRTRWLDSPPRPT